MINDVVYVFLVILQSLAIARIILSWLGRDDAHPVTTMICRMVDPFLKPFQKLIPPVGPGIDFSPIFFFILIDMLIAFFRQS